ncbi:NAD(P)-dependent oxidoreductase [Algirhabdus cladophorae]|uniref:NAD(P)-dependent oxidoreductase n=1 Tax=Algirhabdus cladophorae TaxID=3377108 RepID=UPI003B849618
MGQYVRQRGNHRPLICVAGCGRMGLPMLRSLQEAGHAAVGFDVVAVADDIVLDPTALKDTRTVISVVRDADQTDDLLFGAQDLISNAPHLGCVIISSTLSPRYIHALRKRLPDPITLIDAPMSGAAIAAQNGTLSFMLGGSTTDLDAAQPIFAAMGSSFHRMGPLGAGMQAKVLNNILAAANTVLTRQVLDWSDAAGLNEAKMLDLIAASSGQNWLASGFEKIEFARDGWAEDNSIGILTKDVSAALDSLPADTDHSLPIALRAALFNLTPRSKN